MSSGQQFGQRVSFGLSKSIEPRLTPAPARAEAAFGEAPTSLPIVTFAIVVWLALLFAFECASGFASGPGFDLGHGGLIAFGGVSHQLVVEAGEWWRLTTASQLHANLPHILGNGVVLLLAGYYLERLIGHAWFAAVYVLSGLGGCVASVLLNNGFTVSVGASGAIMGVLAVLGACSLHNQALEQSVRIRRIALRLLIPSIIPFGAATGSSVDFNAHLGGATVGLVMGFALLASWPETGEPPRLRRAAAMIGLAGLAAALVSVAIIGANFPRYAGPARLLAPDSERSALKDQPEAVAARYPRDPLVRLFLGGKLVELNPAAAEREARAGLKEEEILKTYYPDALRLELQGLLAAALMEQTRVSEAVEAARPVCADKDDNLKDLREQLSSAGLCQGAGA